jgi:zinc carboxypeptidase
MASLAAPFAGAGAVVADDATVPTSRFVPTAPCRLADSRSGDHVLPVGAYRWRVDVRGRCGVPAGATAIALSIVAISRDEPGWMTAYAARSLAPPVSLVNYGPGDVRSNGAVVQVDQDGLIVAASGPADFALDVTGFFAPTIFSSHGRYQSLEPERLADTRASQPVTSSLTVPLPATVAPDAIAVAVNVTATDTSPWGYLSVRRTGAPPVATSLVNWDGAAQTRAAFAIVPVSAGGFTIDVMPGATAHVVVDVAGWFTGDSAPPSARGLFLPIAPQRMLDTRQPGSPLGDGVPLYPDGAVQVGGVPGSAAVLNVTMVADEPGWLRVNPAATAPPATSSVNSAGGGVAVANLALTALSTSGWEVASARTSHVVVDLFGWFSGPTVGTSVSPPVNTAPRGQAVYPAGPCDTLVPGLPGLNDSARRPAEYRRIGTSVQGRPIYAERWGPAAAATTIVVIGQVHGDECGGTVLVDELRRRPLTDATVWIIPTLNPDGYVAFTRENASGVNLNRDGLRETEPETRALFGLLDDVHADLVVHGHSPYREAMHFGGELAKGLAWRVARSTGWGFAYAGDLPPDRAFLWQGQEHHRSSANALLLEFAAMSPAEAGTIDRRVDLDLADAQYASAVVVDLLHELAAG